MAARASSGLGEREDGTRQPRSLITGRVVCPGKGTDTPVETGAGNRSSVNTVSGSGHTGTVFAELDQTAMLIFLSCGLNNVTTQLLFYLGGICLSFKPRKALSYRESNHELQIPFRMPASADRNAVGSLGL